MTTRGVGGRAALLVAAVLPSACMQNHVLDRALPIGGTGGGGGVSFVDAGFGGGDSSDGSAPIDGPNGRTQHCMNGTSLSSLTGVTQEIPTIFFVLDRTSSMGKTLGSGTRFSISADAIQNALASYGSLAQLGYVEFPANSSDCNSNTVCCASSPVLVQAGSVPAGIRAALNSCDQGMQVGCVNTDSTPTAQAIKRVANALKQAQGPLYALLMTDGEPSCSFDSSSDLPCTQAINEIASLLPPSNSGHPISTFVMAVGDITGDPTRPGGGNECFDNMALAGGVPRTDALPFYYPANTEATLRSYLTDIISGTICRIDITDSFDATRVEVDFNGNPIPPDATKQNGWIFDPSNKSRILLYGPACTRVINGMVNNPSHQVVVKSCPDPTAGH